jgi:hypothetical protein
MTAIGSAWATTPTIVTVAWSGWSARSAGFWNDDMAGADMRRRRTAGATDSIVDHSDSAGQLNRHAPLHPAPPVPVTRRVSAYPGAQGTREVLDGH